MTFHANGMATSSVPGLQLSTFPWQVVDNQLTTGWNVRPHMLPAAQWLAARWFALTGTIPLVGEETVELVHVSDQSISIRRPSSMGPARTPEEEVMTITRLPE